MNERIKAITGQVLDELVPETWVALGYDKIKEIQNRTAELIINECIDQVAGTKIVGQLSGDKFAELTESADNKYTQWNNALVIATMNVRDHFGVKE